MADFISDETAAPPPRRNNKRNDREIKEGKLRAQFLISQQIARSKIDQSDVVRTALFLCFQTTVYAL